MNKEKICKPIQALVELLQLHGFKVVESRIKDYHFHEVFIKLERNDVNNTVQINIDKIQKVADEKFICTCHWSIVELY